MIQERKGERYDMKCVDLDCEVWKCFLTQWEIASVSLGGLVAEMAEESTE